MSALKYTFLFQLATNVTGPAKTVHRVGGWSESWYEGSDTLVSDQAITNWCQRRAALLPQGAAIIGVRVQQVDPPGPGQTRALNYPGLPANGADVPQMSLLCKATGVGVRNVRVFNLRGIPDGQISEGEYNPVGNFNNALEAFFAGLKSGSWEFRGRDLAAVAHPILTVSTLGAVKFSEPHLMNVGDYVRILRTVDSSGRQRGGRFYVDTAPTPTTMTITGWTYGDTIKGKGRLDGIVYPTVNRATVDRVGVKKVGSPFNRYRGRASNRN